MVNKLVENKLRKLVQKEIKSVLKENEEDLIDSIHDLGLRLILFSHLSDVQDMATNTEIQRKINFVKFLITKYVDNKKINANKEWEEFKTTRYYGKD